MVSRTSVFISYARADSAIAERIYSDLRREGADPWLDKFPLSGGQRWKIEIERAIRASAYFLALLSSRSVNLRGYVKKELRHAFAVLDEVPEASVFLVPVRLDDCHPAHATLNELHWIDLFPSYNEGFRKILRAIGVDAAPIDVSALEALKEFEFEVLATVHQFYGFSSFSLRDLRDRTFYTEGLSRVLYDHMIRGFLLKQLNPTSQEWNYHLQPAVARYVADKLKRNRGCV